MPLSWLMRVMLITLAFVHHQVCGSEFVIVSYHLVPLDENVDPCTQKLSVVAKNKGILHRSCIIDT